MDRIISIPKTIVSRHVLAAVIVGLLILNMLFFATTAPLNSSVVVVVSGFLLAAIDILICTRLLVRFLGRIFPVIRRSRRRVTVAAGCVFVVMLALASLGQLTWRDTGVVIILSLIGYFYSLRFSLSTAGRKQ